MKTYGERFDAYVELELTRRWMREDAPPAELFDAYLDRELELAQRDAASRRRLFDCWLTHEPHVCSRCETDFVPENPERVSEDDPVLCAECSKERP